MASESTPSSTPVWSPPEKIESLFAAAAGNQFAAINAPTAGPRVTQDLPAGDAPFQFYSLATPNGIKPAILLEELGIEYDAWSKLQNACGCC
jgi:GST-like protein